MIQSIPEYSNYRWDYQPQERSGYLRLSNNPVHRTVPLVGEKVLLDLDENNEVVGVEILLTELDKWIWRLRPTAKREGESSLEDGWVEVVGRWGNNQ